MRPHAHTIAIEPELAALLRRAGAEARASGKTVYASFTAPFDSAEPLAFFAAGGSGHRFYWAAPGRDLVLAGRGAAAALAASGTDRFARVREALARLPLLAEAAEPSASDTGPLFAGGFAFAPQPPAGRSGVWEGFPDGLLILPEFLLRRTQAGTWLTQSVAVEPGWGADEALDRAQAARARLFASLAAAADPAAGLPAALNDSPAAAAPVPEHAECPAERKQWKGSVRRLAEAARAGRVEKTVLARALRIALPAVPSVPRLVAALAADHPQSFVFAFGLGDRHFVGATPERLVALAGGRVRTGALAGSIRRGAAPEEDFALGERLLTSAKDRWEHEIVRRWLVERLAPLCARVDAGAQPAVVRFPNVQHLFTPVEAELRQPGAHILDLLSVLHPTPAVGGSPLPEALRLIAEHEPGDRGWYAGPVGWVNARGDGEFAVGIRSAVIDGAVATLFAGCGIVADSDPERELEESRLKLSAIARGLERALA